MNKQNAQRLFDALWRVTNGKVFVATPNTQVRVKPEWMDFYQEHPRLLQYKHVEALSGQDMATTEKELTDKDYKVNFLGYVAICDEFRADGGEVDVTAHGMPKYQGVVGYEALAKWLDVAVTVAVSIVDGDPFAAPVLWAETYSDRYGKVLGNLDIEDYINAIGALRFREAPSYSPNKGFDYPPVAYAEYYQG